MEVLMATKRTKKSPLPEPVPIDSCGREIEKMSQSGDYLATSTTEFVREQLTEARRDFRILMKELSQAHRSLAAAKTTLDEIKRVMGKTKDRQILKSLRNLRARTERDLMEAKEDVAGAKKELREVEEDIAAMQKELETLKARKS